MTNNLPVRRLIKLGALILIGDGLMGVLRPRRQSLLCYFGPELARATSEELAEYPTAARIVYLAEAALGLALVSCRAIRN